MFDHPKVDAEEARAQRDIARRANDEWLSRMILAVLAGDGAGLIALANSDTIVQGHLVLRLLGLVVLGCFLFGVATAFLALVSRRLFHSGRETMFSKRLQQIELDPHLRAAGQDEIIELAEKDLHHSANWTRDRETDSDRYLTRAMWATILGVLLMSGAILLAPSQTKPTTSQRMPSSVAIEAEIAVSPAKDSSTTRKVPARREGMVG